jgi:GPI mannosyltransferase 3
VADATRVLAREHRLGHQKSRLFKLAALVHADSFWGRRIAVAVPQFFLHAAMLASIFRYAARRVDARKALWCLWLVALYAPVLWYGCRTLSESFSTAFLVWGFERLDDTTASRRQFLLGGFLLGCAVVTRFPAAALVLGGMLWLLAQRRFAAFFSATLSGLAVALALGFLDKLTWGDWFHAFIHYFKFNVLSGEAAVRFGALPGYFYFLRLYLLPPAAFGLLFLTFRPGGRWRESLSFLVPAMFYFAVISFTSHKEARFLYSALVLFSVAGIVPFVEWAGSAAKTWKKSLAFLVTLSSVSFYLFDCPYAPERPEQFQLSAKAGPEATGFFLMNEGLWGSGGYFYLGKNIPFCTCDFPQDPCFQTVAQNPVFNRGVLYLNRDEEPRNTNSTNAFLSAGFQIIEKRGQAILFGRSSTLAIAPP